MRERSSASAAAAAEQPAAAQSTQAAAQVTEESYKPVDLDALVARAESSIKSDGQMIDPMSRAYYFYPSVAYFDLRQVPRSSRISESKNLVQKSLDLFSDAFKWYTKLDKVPTQAQAANIHGYMLQLKKDYEKANNMTCSNKTFEELRTIVTYFNDLYTALDGLNQLTGKTVDWSIYGTGAFTPTQVGWDYAKLL